MPPLEPSEDKEEGREQAQEELNSVGPRRGHAKYSIDAVAASSTHVLSPQQLQDWLHHRVSRQQCLSKKYFVSWRNWCTAAVHAIRSCLAQELPHPPCDAQFGRLFYQLAQGVDRGEMPSFAHPTARSAYALEFFCRARLVADLLLTKYHLGIAATMKRTCAREGQEDRSDYDAEEEEEDVYAQKFCPLSSTSTGTTGRTCRVLSLGGGPGYDYVGVLLADWFGTCGHSTTTIQGTVLDYEEGWHDVVEAMNTATQTALQTSSCLQWGGTCDITQSLLDHPSNATNCLPLVDTTDVFICQYTIAENAHALRHSNYIFFQQLFQRAPTGSLILLIEVTPRLWPDIVALLPPLDTDTTRFRIDFCKARNRSNGPQLMIQKLSITTISTSSTALDRHNQRALEACGEFRKLKQLHDRKMDAGFQRQSRKVRGTK
ncbi:expressed unknown protein [Seminavis robusta]|uniref:Uncharacterized protein n=1 Tax=Seminavis robusta TaxID=568900 RepID=A0A9N8H4Z9_9STRA|nr:expressed unknown protein [Seminavis robusta]|eukprot:Sro62_g035470.1 n/a (431) ;mRNA; r:98600-99892